MANQKRNNLESAKKLIENSETELKRWIATKNKKAKAQACKKGWDAYAQILKHINPAIKQQKDFDTTAEDLAKKMPLFMALHSCANTLRDLGSYESYGEEYVVQSSISAIKSFIKSIKNKKITI